MPTDGRPDHPLKDWPAPLRKNAAVVQLAVHIYRARAEYFSLPLLEFSSLPANARDRYVLRASELLKTLMPEPAAGDRVSLRLVSAYTDDDIARQNAADDLAPGWRAKYRELYGEDPAS